MRFSTRWQKIFTAAWPVTLIVLVILVPFAVKKAYDEIKDL